MSTKTKRAVPPPPSGSTSTAGKRLSAAADTSMSNKKSLSKPIKASSPMHDPNEDDIDEDEDESTQPNIDLEQVTKQYHVKSAAKAAGRQEAFRKSIVGTIGEAKKVIEVALEEQRRLMDGKLAQLRSAIEDHSAYDVGPIQEAWIARGETAVDSNDGYVDLLDPIAFDVLHKERSFVEDFKSRRPQLKKAKKRAIVAAKEEIDELVERDKVMLDAKEILTSFAITFKKQNAPIRSSSLAASSSKFSKNKKRGEQQSMKKHHHNHHAITGKSLTRSFAAGGGGKSFSSRKRAKLITGGREPFS